MRDLTCGIPLQLMTPSVTSPDIPLHLQICSFGVSAGQGRE